MASAPTATERFALRTGSDWRSYGAVLATCTLVFIPIALIIPPRLENLTVMLGGLALAAAALTPLLFIATRPGGNWIELKVDDLHIRKWWTNNFSVPYSGVLEVEDSCRHNFVIRYIFRHSPLEAHVDIKLNLETLGTMRAMSGWIKHDGAVHVSLHDSERFVSALRSRIGDVPAQ